MFVGFEDAVRHRLADDAVEDEQTKDDEQRFGHAGQRSGATTGGLCVGKSSPGGDFSAPKHTWAGTSPGDSPYNVSTISEEA